MPALFEIDARDRDLIWQTQSTTVGNSVGKVRIEHKSATRGWTMTTENTSQDQTTLDPQLLAILCCPNTKQEVTLLDTANLKKLNEKIETGELQNTGGSIVKEKLDGGLLRADQAMVYPIRDAIPVMLRDEGISVTGFF